MRYAAIFESDPEAGGFVVTFPDFDGGVTQGDSLEAAYEMAEDLLATIVGFYMETGRPLPDPVDRHAEHWHMVRLPPLADAKAELYRAFLKSGITKAELARRTGIQEANINRLFRLSHQSRLDQLEAAFRALGLKLTVEVHGVQPALTA